MSKMSNGNQTLFRRLLRENNKEVYKKGTPTASVFGRISIIIFSLILTSLFFIFHIENGGIKSQDFSLATGNVWSSPTLVADYSFPVYKSRQQYISEVESAKQASLRVFRLDINSLSNANKRLDGFLNELNNAGEKIPENILEKFSDDALLPFFELKKSEKADLISKIGNNARIFNSKVIKLGYIDLEISKIQKTEIKVVIPPNEFKILKKENLYDRNRVISEYRQQLNKLINTKFISLASELISESLKPNLVYSEELTIRERNTAEHSVPKTLGIVKEGEVIITKGERITEESIQKIQSYKNTEFLLQDESISLLNVVGSFGHAFILYSILLIYLLQFRKRIFFNNTRLLILCSLLVGTALLSWMSIEFESVYPLEYLVFIPAFSMLTAIVFDSRTAFYTTVVMALIMAGIRGNDYTNGIIMLVSGTLAAYTVRDIQNRTQMFQSIFYIFIGFIIPIAAFTLERSNDWETFLTLLVFAVFNSISAPLLTFGLLFLIEHSSSIATDLRLQEYNNLNHPLLLKMNDVSPGTYQHTLAVATLAERCATAIGANSLLAKVGTYFHDIGKVNKPEYFVENQVDDENKHDLLTPRKSAEAIKEHVSKGIEIARQNKLPDRIIDMIPMHHGTSLIKHFYAKALEDSDGKPVNESDFRYPGPKPNTKEAAILMICDSAEAISRLGIENKDELEAKIDRIINDKLHDGQFNDCDINIMELDKIKQTLVKNLTGVTHKRIKYKDIPPKPDAL